MTKSGHSWFQSPVLAVCGWSGSGKTTLIAEAVPRLLDHGLSVAVIKHASHRVDLDTEGKDSDRFFRAGADTWVVAPTELFARYHPEANAESLDSLLARLLTDHDLVLVEGHKNLPFPKVWVEAPDFPPAPDGLAHLLARIPRAPEGVDALVDAARMRVESALVARPVRGGLLLGGDSRRMGRNKALLEFGGRRFVDHVSEALSETCSDGVVLLGTAPEGLSGEFEALVDVPDTVGPLAGMLAAVRWDPRACWLFAACDQPLLTREALYWLLAQRRSGVWAVIPRSADGREQPFPGLYEPLARARLEAQVFTRRPGPLGLAGDPHVAHPAIPRGLEDAFANVNTPHDLERLP